MFHICVNGQGKKNLISGPISPFFLYDDVITHKMCVCMLSNSHEYGWCSLGCDGDAPGGASDVEGNRDSVDTTSSSSVCLCWILSVLRCGTSKENTPLKNS